LAFLRDHGDDRGVPLGRILSRAGFSPLWSIVAFIPIVNLIALWLFAFADWPGSSETK